MVSMMVGSLRAELMAVNNANVREFANRTTGEEERLQISGELLGEEQISPLVLTSALTFCVGFFQVDIQKI